MGAKPRILSEQLPQADRAETGMHGEPIAQGAWHTRSHMFCRVKGPRRAKPQAGRGNGVGLCSPAANTAIPVTGQREPRAPIGSSAKAFPLGLRTAPL